MRLAALILAAGRSRRFGDGNKLLATLGGQPVVRRTVAAVRGAGLQDIIAVTGPDGDAIAHVLADVRCGVCGARMMASGWAIRLRRAPARLMLILMA